MTINSEDSLGFNLLSVRFKFEREIFFINLIKQFILYQQIRTIGFRMHDDIGLLIISD